MGAMYKLKAYFGMVPADDLGDYVDDAEPQYPPQRRGDRWDDRPVERDRGDYDDEDEPQRPDDRWERARGPVRSGGTATRGDAAAAARLRTAAGPVSAGSAAMVHGALAVDRDTAVTPERASPEPVPEPPRPNPLARITTLQPRSYNEARTIGERYRDGIPVIMNLTELDDAAAKRLVDFAAGLAFALRGSIDKVTSRVFLLTPPEVEVSADDARLIAERGRLFGD
ncbi:MAG: cell division protein SepF [Pseudonocardia sp.]